MPWSPSDAKRHKKGLSPKQARKWAHIANGVLRRCLADGGSVAACEASAVRQANGAVGEPAHSTNQRRLTISTALTVQPSRLTMNNREYLTAPAVLIVEGVLNQAYISREVFVPQDWDAMPVVLNHPMDGTGEAMSARSPEVLATHGVGYLYRSRLGVGQRSGQSVGTLQAEIWLDVAQVQQLGGAAMQAMTMLEAAQPVEVSTGFYSDAIRERGSFYGTPYREILVNLRPDHLALLPNAIGACSWQDGCGCPRLNHTQGACACTSTTCTCEEVPMTDEPSRGFFQRLRDFLVRETATPDPPSDDPDEEEDGAETEDEEDEEAEAEVAIVTEQTDTDIREALMGCLAREMGMNVTPYYIQDVDHATNSFIYRMGERLCRRYWLVGEDGLVALTGDKEDVQRSTNYTGVPDTAGPVEEEAYHMQAPSVMVKTRVTQLINNPRSGWTEMDRAMLERMDEAVLIRMAQQPQQQEVPPPQEPSSLEQALAYIPAEFGVRETLASAVRRYERHKTKLIEQLLTVKTNPFTAEELGAMEDVRLEQLVVMAGEELPEPQTRPQSDYRGRRMPNLRIVQDENEAVPAPPDTMALVVERQKALGLR
jgi:hypothetical protein